MCLPAVVSLYQSVGTLDFQMTVPLPLSSVSIVSLSVLVVVVVVVVDQLSLLPIGGMGNE